ncbi:MAG: hypothetical protein D6780_01205 [Candidatus Dadabacteria bacterium]|nr:MAG: hypothetical protein D6780_01205 [Candidatus Dadabacteria bacterium]
MREKVFSLKNLLLIALLFFGASCNFFASQGSNPPSFTEDSNPSIIRGSLRYEENYLQYERGRAKTLLDKGASTLEILLSSLDKRFTNKLLSSHPCFIVFPETTRVAVLIGGVFGEGFMLCKRGENAWSEPFFVKIRGASAGLTLGAEFTEIVLVLSNQGAAKRLVKGEIRLGSDLALAAGPLGREVGTGLGIKNLEKVYYYARAKGLFVGISLNGAKVSPLERVNTAYFQKPVTVEDVIDYNVVPLKPLKETARVLEALQSVK